MILSTSTKLCNTLSGVSQFSDSFSWGKYANSYGPSVRHILLPSNVVVVVVLAAVWLHMCHRPTKMHTVHCVVVCWILCWVCLYVIQNHAFTSFVRCPHRRKHCSELNWCHWNGMQLKGETIKLSPHQQP